MGIFDNKVNLALATIVGFAIIGMVMVPSFAANGQENSDVIPVQFPAPPTEAPEETPEETSPTPEGGLPVPEEGAPAPEEPATPEGDLTTPEEPTPFGAPAPEEEPLPAPGEETPLPEPFGASTPSEEEPLPGEEPTPFGAPAPEEPAPGEEPEGLAPEEPEGLEAAAEGVFSSSVSMSPTPDSEATITIEGAGMTIQDMNVDQTSTGTESSSVIAQGTFAIEPDGAAPEPIAPEREGAEGFFSTVTFSPAEGSWAAITIEGTGVDVQSMSVSQSMEGEDTFNVTVEVVIGTEVSAGMLEQPAYQRQDPQ